MARDFGPSGARLIKYWMASVGGLAAALLYGHTFHPSGWNVDVVSLGLLGLLLLVPVAHRITRIKVGDFEAELTRQEAERKIDEARREAEDLPQLVRLTEVPIDEREAYRAWSSGFDDAGKATAADRIDLERSLRRVAELAGVDVRGGRSLGAMTEALWRSSVIEQSAAAAIRDVLPVLNEAAHGEIVDWSLAFEMHQVVSQLIGYLDSVGHSLLGRRDVTVQATSMMRPGRTGTGVGTHQDAG